MFPGDDLAGVAVLVIGRQAGKPRRLRPLFAEHLPVRLEKTRERDVIPSYQGILGRLPDGRFLGGSRSSGDLVRKGLPGREAVLARDFELRVGELTRAGWFDGLPALQKIFR